MKPPRTILASAVVVVLACPIASGDAPRVLPLTFTRCGRSIDVVVATHDREAPAEAVLFAFGRKLVAPLQNNRKRRSRGRLCFAQPSQRRHQ